MRMDAMEPLEQQPDPLQARADAAFVAGRLRESVALYTRLLERRPDSASLRLQLALAHKYLREWPASLRHALAALSRSSQGSEGASWTAGIAATALGDWAQARRQWQHCGIAIAAGEGPPDEALGPVGLRLNPWSGGETVFAQRLDPARARIANVPLPGSGHRYGDIVLHDGLQVGQRHWFERTVPVFNEIQRLQQSEFATFTVFAACDADEDVEALQGMQCAGVGLVEDWSAALRHRCLRCSEGIPHRHARHAAGNDAAWNPDRTLGVAAQSPAAVGRLLEQWVAAAPSRRRLEAIDSREAPGPAPPADEAGAWWLPPR